MKGLILLVLFVSIGAQAQSSAGDVPQVAALPVPASLQLSPRIGIGGEVSLTLPQVIFAVLENNRDIEISRIDRQKAAQSLRSARGYFDPVLGGTAYKLRNVSPVSSSLGGATNGKVSENDLNGDPQVSGNSPWFGTTYKLDLASTRENNSSTFNTLNPTFVTAAALNLTQPLWSGLLFDLNRERIGVARNTIGQTDEQFREKVIEITTQAVRAYLELDYAQRNLEVQIESVNLAEQQDASNRRQVAQGTQAPVDVIQTQTQISTNQQNVFNAQEQLTRAENTLKVLMLPDRHDPLWGRAIRTSTADEIDSSAATPTLEAALQQALSSRPELKIGDIGIEANRLAARLAKEQARPQVNLTAQLASQGIAGTVLPQSSNVFGDIFAPLYTQVDELSALAGLPPVPVTTTSTASVPSIFVGGYGQSPGERSQWVISDY